jgi:ribose-phosphate pyrophosphokinase
MKIIAGNSNRPLGEEIAKRLGQNLTATNLRRFADQEIFVEVQENVRGQQVFVIQATSNPTNDNLMELLIILDALKRASAQPVVAVIPYFGYARQDRKSMPRTPITAKLVADLLTVAGAHHVVTVDLHAAQIQGFFNIRVDNLYAAPMIANDIQAQFGDTMPMIISPDVGGVVRARSIARRLDTDLAIIDKRRERAGVSEVMNVIGQVAGRDCVLLDDMVDTAGTLCNAATAIMEGGARSVSAYSTHGVLSGPAIERINASPLTQLVITDSIQPRAEVLACSKIRILSLAPMLAEAIRRIHEHESVSSLFHEVVA